MPCSSEHTYQCHVLLTSTYISCSSDVHTSLIFSWPSHYQWHVLLISTCECHFLLLPTYQYHVLLTSTHVSWSPQIYIYIKFSWSLYLNVMLGPPISVYSHLMSTYGHVSIMFDWSPHINIMFFWSPYVYHVLLISTCVSCSHKPFTQGQFGLSWSPHTNVRSACTSQQRGG